MRVNYDDFKPCPFCGIQGDVIIRTFDIEDREGFPTTITCEQCGCSGPWCYTPERNTLTNKLLNLWNTRAN